MYIIVTINQPSWRISNNRNWFEFLHIVCTHTFCRYSVFPTLLVLFLFFHYNSAQLIQSTVVCHLPNFALGHNGLITFVIFMRVCQIDAKGQIIAKEKNY